MPTSSQALILLAADGRLPKKVPRRTFPLSSVPYPTRNLDINATCVDYSDSVSEDDLTMNVFEAVKKSRLRLSSIVDSISDAITITSYRGSLYYDPKMKLLRWQMDSNTAQQGQNLADPFLTNRSDGNDLELQKRRLNQQVRFPTIENTDVYNYTYGDGNSYEHNGWDKQHQIGADLHLIGQEDGTSSESKMKKALSLPSLFKARMDEKTYQRLCNLGFRRPKGSKHSSVSQDKSKGIDVKKGNVDIPTSEGLVDEERDEIVDLKDKDFRLEDLNLQTDSGILSGTFKLTHNGENGEHRRNESLEEYLVERNAFFAKYGNYKAGELPVCNHGDGAKYKARRQLHTRLILPDIGIHSHGKLHHVDSDDSEYHDDSTKRPEKMSLLDEVKEKSNYNKWKKKRLTSVRLRKETPPSEPLCVCFTLKDNARSHKEIKDMVEEHIGSKVGEIQFDPVSVHAVDSDAKSRWIVRMLDSDSCNLLIDIGLIVDGERVEVRLLDDAVKKEVEAYKLYEMVQKGKLRMPGTETPRRRRKARGHTGFQST